MIYSVYSFLRKATLLSSIVFLSYMASYAQEVENKAYTDDELYSMDLEKLVTVNMVSASKINLENEGEAAGVVTVVTHEQIVNSGAKNIEEVLRTVAGFDVIRTGFSPNAMIVVRGLYSTEGTNNKVLFLIDGHPFRSLFYSDATVFAGNVSLNNIAKIEIIRGPGSTLFGAGAFLGVVNIVTKEAKKNVETSLSAGSFGTYEFAALSTFTGKSKKYKATISGSHFTTDGPDITVKSDLAKEQLDPFGPAVGYDASTSMSPGTLNYARKTTQFNLNGEWGKFYLKSLFANSADSPPVGPYDALTRDNDYGNRTAFGELGFKLPLGEKQGELLIKTYYDYSKMSYRQTLWSTATTQLFNHFTSIFYPRFEGLATGPAMFYAAGEGQVYHIEAEHEGIGSEANLAYNFNDKVKLITGLMYETNRQFGVNTHANANIYYEYDPSHLMYIGDRNYLPLEAFGEQLDITSTYNWNRNASRQIFAAFCQAEINLVNTLKIKKISNLLLTLGGRYDHYSDAGERFNPRAALVFIPHKKIYFKALYGTAFRAPSFSELYTTHNSVTVGDSNLKPETVITEEFVIGYKTGGKSEVSVTYFDTHIKNNIQLSNSTSGTSFARQYANIGEINSQGLEASFRYMPTPKFLALFNFTYQHVVDVTHDQLNTTVSGTGETISYTQEDFHPGGIPKYIFNASFNYAILRNIGFNMSANYLGERIRTDKKVFEPIPGSAESTGNVVLVDTRENIDARLLLNASVRFHSFKFAPGLALQVSGYNVTNAKNYNAAGAIRGDDLRREGSNWLAKVSYHF